MNFFKNKTVLIVIVLFIVAFVAYALMRDSGSSSTGVKKQSVSTNTVTTAGGAPALDGPGKEFVTQLLAIQNINFALDIFEDPVFRGLQDWSREIQPQEAGRPNPFAPLGDESRVASPATAEDAIANIEEPVTTKPAAKPATPTTRRR
ncbi:MAG: hypothetical protein FGM57_03975 [Candidatus Taylorbacteria bacterium]|nr:hypothetical protein [Candidatus Taylorbacteria bacterium]